jgi:hypothetical protein
MRRLNLSSRSAASRYKSTVVRRVVFASRNSRGQSRCRRAAPLFTPDWLSIFGKAPKLMFQTCISWPGGLGLPPHRLALALPATCTTSTTDNSPSTFDSALTPRATLEMLLPRS